MKMSEVYEIEHFALYNIDENDYSIHINGNADLRQVIAVFREANNEENKSVIKMK